MERLTNSNEEIKTLQAENEAYWLNVYFKLKEYEDLEEQDLLLKLPCKVGTDLYVVGTRCLADEEPNEEWCTAHDCDKCVYDNTYTVFKTVATKYILFMLVAETDENYILDKTVFLTKEEAEEALRKKVE